VWVDLKNSSTSFQLAYSTDDGVSWHYFGWHTGAESPGKKEWSFYLDNVRATDLKWNISMRTTDERYSPVLRGVSVAYLPQPEPNWMWSFVVPVADKWELMDGTTEVKNTNSLIAYLEGLFRTQALQVFVDIDGKQWSTGGQPGVLVYDINVLHYDVERPTREADVRITLLETVETYV